MNNRIKSFLWRVGMMILAYACAAVAANLGVLQLNIELTTILGLVLGEVSKAINNSFSATPAIAEPTV